MRLFIALVATAIALLQAGALGAAVVPADGLVEQHAVQQAGVSSYRGDEAAPGQFPWMLAITVDNARFCGGSLISEQWALTSAHCLYRARNINMIAGSLHREGGTEGTVQIVSGNKAYQHPGYNPRFMDNDVGLVQSSRAFSLNENVQPIRLASYSMGIDKMVGQVATFSGWGVGSDASGAPQPDKLQFIDLTVSDGSACRSLYGSAFIDTKLCFETKKDRKSPCAGDQGGPLVVKEADGVWTQIGLASFGADAGCTVGLPVVFTRLASVLRFIETTSGVSARD